jgi:hypothetical protein
MEQEERLAVWTNIVSEVCAVFFGYTLASAGVKFAFGVFEGVAYTDFVYIGAFLAALDAAIRYVQFEHWGTSFDWYRSNTEAVPDGMTMDGFRGHVHRSAYAGGQIFVTMVVLYLIMTYIMSYGLGFPSPGSLTAALLTTPYGTIGAAAIFIAFTQFYAQFQRFPLEPDDIMEAVPSTEGDSTDDERDETGGEDSGTESDEDAPTDVDSEDDGDDAADDPDTADADADADQSK